MTRKRLIEKLGNEHSAGASRPATVVMITTKPEGDHWDKELSSGKETGTVMSSPDLSSNPLFFMF
ncbi:MAG TPA: hypothetical protein VGK02_10980 [Candidatus Aquicultor sp.]